MHWASMLYDASHTSTRRRATVLVRWSKAAARRNDHWRNCSKETIAANRDFTGEGDDWSVLFTVFMNLIKRHSHLQCISLSGWKWAIFQPPKQQKMIKDIALWWSAFYFKEAISFQLLLASNFHYLTERNWRYIMVLHSVSDNLLYLIEILI